MITTMKKYFYMAVAAIAVLSSCSNDNEYEPNKAKQAHVFTATMEGSDGTRATYNSINKCAEWEVGDVISINGKTYSAQEAGTTATFEAVDGDAESIDGKYMAYFPASLYDGTTATLPASQTYTAGKFNMPMYATNTTTTLAFKNLCAVLAITVTSEDIATLNSIKVISDQKMNGTFTVSDDQAVVGTDGTNLVELVSDEDVTLTEEGTTFYIAIPAQTYQNLSILVSNGTVTKVMTTKTDQDIDVVRNTIYPIAFVGSKTITDEAPVSESAGIAGNKVKWIQLWDGGPKFAEYNVGVTDGKAESAGGYYKWGSNVDKGGSAHAGSDISGYDTATNLWGENWRMPTNAEFEELISNCDVEAVNEDSKFLGCKFTGRGVYAYNSVLIPAVGLCTSDGVNGIGYHGNYWSSTPDGSNACAFFFQSGTLNPKYIYGRSKNLSVRAVLK